jgi:ribosomal-protein-serine acetyltransferase
MFSLPVREGVSLVLAEPRHAKEIADLIARNFDRLVQYEPWGDTPPDTATMRERIQERAEAFAQGRGVRTYIRVPEQFIGACGLRINPAAGSGEVGFFVDRDYEGRGLVSACVRVLVGLAFREYGLERVTLKTHAENDRARKLAERLGFSWEGTARRAIHFGDCRYEDEATYAVLADEWATKG